MLICLHFSLSSREAHKTVKAFHKDIQYMLCIQVGMTEEGWIHQKYIYKPLQVIWMTLQEAKTHLSTQRSTQALWKEKRKWYVMNY